MAARKMHRLGAMEVTHAVRPGYYADGGGLYLQVTRLGGKSWVFRYERNGRRAELGLGAFLDGKGVSLAQARRKAAELRALLAVGRDPMAEKRARLAQERSVISFREAAETYIASHAPSWRNPKHGDQWRNTLATYANPVLGELPVHTIDIQHVVQVLEPIWTTKTETATRVRGRIESVLDWATVRRYRSGENPARWRGYLDKLLARPTRVHKVEHFAALPHTDVPAFLAELQEQPGTAALALRFCILTATRSGEAIGCRWDEIEGEIWTVPGSRTKSGRPHRVPLSEPARAVLAELRSEGGDAYVFAGNKPGKSLSNMAMTAVLRRMERTDVTVHGFRSAFRDWCGGRTNFPREVAEAALAHVLKDKTEAAYARGDLFLKRRQLMDAWARFCCTKADADAVLPMVKRG